MDSGEAEVELDTLHSIIELGASSAAAHACEEAVASCITSRDGDAIGWPLCSVEENPDALIEADELDVLIHLESV